jgi:outer membrane murein-binding lipoprotein Lpp
MSEERLERIEQRLNHLESDVSTLKSDVSTLKADVSIVKQNVNALREDVNEIRIRITSLEGTIVTAIREGFGTAQANIQDVSYGLGENERKTRLLNQRVSRLERQSNDE